jgi:predicted nucleotidyltransferase
MEWKRTQMPVEGPTSEKVVPMEKVEDHLRRGWSFVTRLDDRRCVIRKRRRDRLADPVFVMRVFSSWLLEETEAATMRHEWLRHPTTSHDILYKPSSQCNRGEDRAGIDMDTIRRIRDHRPEIARRFRVEQLGVFGSVSRGEDTSSSDVDILVRFEEGEKTFDNYMELKFYLEELLEREVDLLTFESIHPLMKERILREAVYV